MATVTLDVWAPLQVLATSYANFKEIGISPTSIAGSTRGYGDFYQDGRRSLFTASSTYDRTKPIAQATGALYEFWRFLNGAWARDNSILSSAASTCVHPRQELIADFNGDGKPDIFLVCHGYDAGPFPGERNQVVLSSASGTYAVRDASPDVGFWHGGAAGDIDGDGDIDVVVVPGNRPVVLLNDGSGQFARESTDRFAEAVPLAPWWTVQITDVNEDGRLDVLLGGTEFATCAGRIPEDTCSNGAMGTLLLATSSGSYSVMKLPEVAGEGLILDFVLTGSGSTRTVWVNRTTSGPGVPAYNGRTLQRVVLNGLQSSVAYTSHTESWVAWLLPLTINGNRYVGSDNSRDNFVPVAVP
jgi:hypothetical protein